MSERELEEVMAADPDSCIRPNRGDLSDPSIKWRKEEEPNYDLIDLAYFKGKTQRHRAGSLEKIVEDLVKTWEMEAAHKADITQWETVDLPNYQCQANGGQIFPGEEAAKIGNYNWLFSSCPKELYDSEKEDYTLKVPISDSVRHLLTDSHGSY